MPTPDQLRLEHARTQPRIVALWQALRPLQNVVRLMNSGAHPDDETSDFLAAAALDEGLSLSYACSTRGEGGQNDIGTESGPALGALRTREMERACDVLNMRLYWHGTAPDDTITDFRFSKSATETMQIWGESRLMQRFVEIVRTDRPDILIPTFLDVPGQHGHHRAMTQAAHQVMRAAADPAFPCDLPPWQISKLYLPAWSGAGQAYDDDLPPPPATLTVDASGHDPVTGWSYALIGQMSRGFHRTQGMGRWVPPGRGRKIPLHLAETRVQGRDRFLTSGLPVGLHDTVPDTVRIWPLLSDAQAHCDQARIAFPKLDQILLHANEALTSLNHAIADCPADLAPLILHRLTDKRTQLGHVIRLASGITASAETADTWLRPGDSTPVTLSVDPGRAKDVTARMVWPQGWTEQNGKVTVAPDAAPTDAYRSTYDPAAPPAPHIALDLNGTTVALPMTRPPVVLPATVARLTPEAALINLRTPARSLSLTLGAISPAQGTVTLDTPKGWDLSNTTDTATLTLPDDVAPGLYALPLRIDGALAQTETRIAPDHVDPTAVSAPAALRVRVLDVTVPEARVGYIGSGHDAVADWLTALGVNLTVIPDDALAQGTPLRQFDTLIIGVFALRFRAGLADVMPLIHDWVQGGGTLLTLYHRPWDNWDPDSTPPKRLEIGQPSLRWRVTDATATVTHLADHPCLSTPNQITPEDWSGWVKERGLYFAKSWDAAYTPLLSMSDPDEAPLTGALLSAEIGKGRHTHCALILHHQMAHLVPGAYRLMANLITPRA